MEMELDSFELPDGIADMLKTYLVTTGRGKNEILCEALERFLHPYKADEGYPIEAIFLEGNSPYERQVEKNEGRKPEIRERKCFVLGKKTMFGNPYYRLMVDDQLIETPIESVRLPQREGENHVSDVQRELRGSKKESAFRQRR